MKIRKVLLISLLCVMGSYAEDIMVSWESNGVLVATGMEPGSSYTVEWTADLQDGFINNPSPFEGLVANSNGVGQVAIPMFFRVRITPIPPEGMVQIPAGINSGTDPDFGAYSLTNEAAFYMDKYGVTKEKWDEVHSWAVTNGYSFNSAWSKAANHPALVSWYKCVEWCNARSEMEGKTPCYNLSTWSCDFNANGYRLPTNTEREYAARGGLQGKRFPWGDTINHNCANYRANGLISYDISPYTSNTYHPMYDDGNYPSTSPVGSFTPNGYGLYDMSGNLREWCNTESDSGRYPTRSTRGGNCYHSALQARCGNEYWADPYGEPDYFGFRAVCR